MKAIFQLLSIVLITGMGFGVGGYTAHKALSEDYFLDTLERGGWVAYPTLGTPDADPYLRARGAQRGDMPLGAGEGITFEIAQDSAGRPLDLACNYTLFGPIAAARLWTISYAAVATTTTPGAPTETALFHAQSIAYEDDIIDLSIGRRPQPGNWHPLEGKGRFKLIMRLYDSPITSTTGLSDFSMPLVARKSCS